MLRRGTRFEEADRKSRCFGFGGPSITTIGVYSRLAIRTGSVTLRSVVDLRSRIRGRPKDNVRPFGVILVLGDCTFPDPKGKRLRKARKVDLPEAGVVVWLLGSDVDPGLGWGVTIPLPDGALG